MGLFVNEKIHIWRFPLSMHSGASSQRGVEGEPSRSGDAALFAQQTGALTRQQQFPDIFSYFCPTWSHQAPPEVSRCSSLGATGLNNDSPDFPSLSLEGNMDSAKIGEALSSSYHKPSLFQPFPLPPCSLQSSTPSLPPPLLPEVAPAPASVPELLPRYSK